MRYAIGSVVIGIIVLAALGVTVVWLSSKMYVHRSTWCGATRTPRGWTCSRWVAHDGPCAARPAWWNLRDRIRFGTR